MPSNFQGFCFLQLVVHFLLIQSVHGFNCAGRIALQQILRVEFQIYRRFPQIVHFRLRNSLGMFVSLLCSLQLFLCIGKSVLFRVQLGCQLLQVLQKGNLRRIMFREPQQVFAFLPLQLQCVNLLLQVFNNILSFFLITFKLFVQYLRFIRHLVNLILLLADQNIKTFLLNHHFVYLPLKVNLLAINLTFQLHFIDVHSMVQILSSTVKLLLDFRIGVLLFRTFVIYRFLRFFMCLNQRLKVVLDTAFLRLRQHV